MRGNLAAPYVPVQGGGGGCGSHFSAFFRIFPHFFANPGDRISPPPLPVGPRDCMVRAPAVGPPPAALSAP